MCGKKTERARFFKTLRVGHPLPDLGPETGEAPVFEGFAEALLGAGAGGFLLVFAKPENHTAIKSALADFQTVEIQPDNSGSSVVYYHAS